ncbi:hypothetical protein ACFS5L_32185 [Streptomyces phyllanthi]|uniref:Uncharacterized protein n=1 Tax=Streptomyces phyllanthi TaxID=1803180 RepID=A0A5N8WGL9_9ACTN|nr:hypothetical protein [Streptomyces phyllanthi]MPY45648.1 hypothetical protein [Streptomyces phyllanthi]
MTRINRPDSLLTELRDIKRRLHALETAQRGAPATGTALAAQSLSGPTDESAATNDTTNGTANDTTGSQSTDDE